MKKLILIFVLITLSTVAYASFTNSADNYRTTFLNGYAWSGNVPQDKARLWTQEVEAKLEGETASLSLLTVLAFTDSTTLTTAMSGSVITMASTGTGVVTLPPAAAGLNFTVVDHLITAAADVTITAGTGDGINGGAEAGSVTNTSDAAGAYVRIVAVDTASWIITSASWTL